MIVFPNAKINLGLSIVSKRSDGFHDIETCFIPVPWTDILEIVPANKLSFETSGLMISGKPDDNLCLKAYHLLNKKYKIPPVSIHLHKIIPMGAGLGGGSSDAAFVLKLLNDLFELNIPLYELEKIASEIGSDCAFFINNTSSIARGKGNELCRIVNPAEGMHILVVYPNIHISTSEAYRNSVPKQPDLSLEEILNLPRYQWKNFLKNDFENYAFTKYPELDYIKKAMYDAGAQYASMSGSGSAIFGLFQNPNHSLASPFHKYIVWQGLL